MKENIILEQHDKIEISDQEYEDYGKIINSAITSLINKGAAIDDREDYYQDGWMKLIDYKIENGELPDFGMAKKILRDFFVDNIRKAEKRNTVGFGTGTDDDSTDEDRVSWLGTDDWSSAESVYNLKLQDLFDKFPKGTKERTFIDWYLEQADVKRDFMLNPEADISKKKEGYTDSVLAVKLGFKGTDDQQWKNFRDRMRRIIKLYL